jgi:hypothetical protein
MRYLSLFLIIVFVVLVPRENARAWRYPTVIVSEQGPQQLRGREQAENPLLAFRDKPVNAVEVPHVFESRNRDFLLAVFLIACIALFRFVHPAYFRNLFRAFRNATLSSRQLKDQLQQDYRPGILMNLFFCFSAALFTVQVIRYFGYVAIFRGHDFGLVLGVSVLVFALIYSARYVFLKLAGWLFQIPEMMDNYAFHIFLLNKIAGIILIPFTIVLAFGSGAWVQVSLLIAFITLCFLIIYRYVRSRKLFQYFLKFSKFHFFLYLCASEILPIAILIRLLSKLLYF